MNKIAVFGSLKKGFYNHSRFGLGEPLTKSKIKGAMYLMYSYPHLKRAEFSEHGMVREHEVEIYEVEDSLYHTLLRMEIGAGYQEFKTNLTCEDGNKHDVTIFFSRDNYDCSKLKFLEAYSKETVPEALSK